MIRTTEAYGFTFAYPAGDTTVGHCLAKHGEFARIGATLCAEFSRGGTFIDVGANIGAIALPVSRSARRVIAIEAHPGLADLLRTNAAAAGNIEVVHAAASDRAGIVSFPAPALEDQANFGRSGFGLPGPKIEVPAVCLDRLAPDDTLMVKIDVEGHEYEVLQGADALLARGVRWLVETDPNGPKSREVVQLFLDRGYRTYWLWDTFVTPRAPKAPWEGKRLGDLNVLAVPRDQRQPAEMVEVTAGFAWPRNTLGFGYLRHFGIPEFGG